MPRATRTCTITIAALAATLLPQVAAAQCPISLEDAALHPEGRSVHAISVDTDGDHLVAGRTGTTDVYRRLGGGWALAERLEGAAAVAVDGQWLARAPHHPHGKIFLYRLVADEWVLWQEIASPVSDPGFGTPLAMEGARLVAGRVATHIYAFNSATELWELEATLPHAASRVALHGSRLAMRHSPDEEVHVYQRLADATWAPVASPEPPVGSSQFGSALAFDGDDLLVGASGTAEQRGAVYVYEQAGDGYQLAATLVPASPFPGERFGSAVAVSDDVLIVTGNTNGLAPSSPVHPFVRSPTGWLHVEPIDGSRYGGDAAALSGGQLAVSDASVVRFSAGISDFDHNGILDRCDVHAGTYADLDCDNTPDVSPLDREPAVDCDGDGQLDGCVPFVDCDTNHVPDGCQLALGLSNDCNANGRPDWCDINAGFSDPSGDCNGNGVPDECDIAIGTSADCNGDGIPDECDPNDCNDNSLPDDCEIANGLVEDCNHNGVPDECECRVRAGCTFMKFTNVTIEAGLANNEFALDMNQIGPSHWSGGGAVADFNNDGWQDVFFVAGLNADSLYINNGDGTFRDEAAAWGILPGTSFGASVADFNNDGWLDLLVSTAAEAPGTACRLYRNNGDSTFTDVAIAAGLILPGALYSTAWGDYDADGDLDLATVEYGNGQARIFRNEGNGTFTERTAGMLGLPPTSFNRAGGRSVRFVDLDGDRRLDLILTFSSQSRYFGNVGSGMFEDRRASLWRPLSYGFAVSDFDEDGDFDLYSQADTHRNDDGIFVVVPNDGTAPANQIMATTAADVDHDAKPDLLLTSKYDGHFLYRNVGEQGSSIAFEDASPCTGFNVNVSGRGIATLDYDADGDRDVLLFAQEGSSFSGLPALPTLLRNDLSGPETNWIRIFLETAAASDIPPNGIGSIVKVRLGDGPDARTLMNFIDGGSNYLSQSELSAHFGLAGAAMIDEIIVEWTNGATTTLTNIPANQTLTISAPPTLCAADLDQTGTVDVFDLLMFLDAWFEGDADFDDSGTTDVFDLLAYLDAWFEGC